MNDCVDRDAIERFHADELTADSRRLVHSHLRACTACRHVSDRLAAEYDAFATEIRQIAGSGNTTAVDKAPARSISRSDSPMSDARHSIEGYELLEQVHRGGQGVVYRAAQKSTRREVAIKLLIGGLHASDAAKRRFEREVELVAQMRHPGIVSVFDSGMTPGGDLYCVMDFIDGMPLDRHIREHKLALRDALSLFAAVCEAVSAAHRHGIIHRDLKPLNVLVDKSGAPRVVDFGLAKALEPENRHDVSVSGQLLGTLPYMSPEQATSNGNAVDLRTDVYSLGVMLYETLTGCSPYPIRGNVGEVMNHIANTPPLSMRKAWCSGIGISAGSGGNSAKCPIDRDLETIVVKALSKSPERRYQSAADLARDLRHYLEGEAIEARRDSAIYVVRKTMLGTIRRNPAMAYVVIPLIAGTVAFFGADLIIRGEQGIEQSFADTATEYASTFAPIRELSSTAMVLCPNDTDYVSLLKSLGLPHDQQDERANKRRVHAAILERLAQAKPRVVSLALVFTANSTADTAMTHAFDLLDRKHVPVVLATDRVGLDPAGFPHLNHEFAKRTRWGHALSDMTANEPWQLHLLVDRGGVEAEPSLALTTFAAWREPECRLTAQLTNNPPAARLSYQRLDGPLSQVRIWSDVRDTVPLRGIAPMADTDAQTGLRPGDSVGEWTMATPDLRALSGITYSYQTVLDASKEQLAKWFDGRCVMIGTDSTRLHPSGRNVPIVAIHTMAIDQMISGAGTDIAAVTVQRGIVAFLAVVLATAIGLAIPRRHSLRIAATVSIVGLSIYTTILLAIRYQYILIPFSILTAFVVASEIAAATRRSCSTNT